MEKEPEKIFPVYEKPRLRVIELTAEEVLATGCKTVSGGASYMGIGCQDAGCYSNGT